MTEQLSGSRLPLARQCRWAFRNDVTYPRAPNLYDSAGGTKKHDAFSSYIDSGTFPPTSDPEERLIHDQMRAMWGCRRQTNAWSSEVAFALHPEQGTARILGKHINRNYGQLLDGEIPLTVDYLGVESGVAVVGDWKPPFDPHVEGPLDNLQLLAGGAAAAYVHGSEGCILELARVQMSEHYTERVIASPMALARAMAEMVEIQATIAGAEARAGDHCAYCPALGGCPETQRAIVSAGGQAIRAKWSTEYISDANDALLVDELAAVKKILEAVEKSLKQRASDKGGIVLPDGKVWKAVVSKRSGPKADLVKAALGARYAEVVVVTEYESFRRVNA